MIVLFTDFGLHGPYTGQMKAVLHQMAPGIPDLFSDAPVGNPKASAYLLAAYAVWFPTGTVFLCVIDPGVGGTRPPVIVKADGRWYVGPGNGRFELIQRRAAETFSWDIGWKPERLSASFHGRDGGPRRDRLYRPFRQCHDRPKGGQAAGRRKARRSRSRAGGRDDLQQSAARHGLLIRELERACRDCRQSRARGRRARSRDRQSCGDRPLNETGCPSRR
jgi:S-adenosylmethionine hydroxide adenosyltransferase-like protein